MLNIYSPDPQHFSTGEVALLKEMAGDLAYGIRAQRTTRANEDYAKRLSESLLETVQAIALTVEQRDSYTSGHMDRVRELAVAIATEMELPQAQISGLSIAATIHDLGKIYVPSEILSRPGKLSDPEFEIVKTHSQVGYDIIKHVSFEWPVADIILQHHERLDGSGYPQGLKGDEIRLGAQILAVADMVDAISTHRPYREAEGIDRALEIIQEEKGAKLNATAVDICTKLFTEKGFKFSSQF